MSELYFVRHGQAAFGTADYDRLSPLGVQQAEWLGQYLARRGTGFDRVVTGRLRRHRETLDGIQRHLPFAGGVEVDGGLDEYSHEAIHAAHAGIQGGMQAAAAGGAREFYRSLDRALRAWADGTLGGELPETWAQFTGRVSEALARVCVGRGQRVLVVSSGGVMAVVLGLVLELSGARTIDLNMQVRNSAFSHFYYDESRVQLAAFNQVPHLECPDRWGAITLS